MENTQDLKKSLKHHFGYNEFRPHQKEIIQTILDEKDILAILPTGSGKSICYQLPALMMDGTTIVVSPLIALMQDQVDTLVQNGIKATVFNSTLSSEERRSILDNLEDYKLVYLAPERFEDDHFIEQLKTKQIRCFAIDEAHCISQWGHAFRPHYRQLNCLKEHFPKTPIAAFTASATPEVKADIIKQLNLFKPNIILSSFDRPNLTIRIHERYDQDQQLHRFLETRKEDSGIIYASTRRKVDQLHAKLEEEGYSVTKYHAGLSDSDRQANQSAFITDDTPLMVATVAFGMGIHKPDIRFVVHIDMPKNIEQYYQEIGRAGRDGLAAESYLLFSTQDLMLQKKFSDDIQNDDIRYNMHHKTEDMFAFCNSDQCRRIRLLGYFGEIYTQKRCENCDVCIDGVQKTDGSIESEKIIDCIQAVKERFGITHVTDILAGDKTERVTQFKHQKLKSFGSMKNISKAQIRFYIYALIDKDILTITKGQYPILQLGNLFTQLLTPETDITFRKKVFAPPKTQKESKVHVSKRFEIDQNLFQALRKHRKMLADKKKIAPYMIFSDKTLVEMCEKLPSSRDAFQYINGVGPQKLEQWGDEFLEIIQMFKMI